MIIPHERPAVGRAAPVGQQNFRCRVVLTDEEISMRAVGWSSRRTFADINMLEKQQRAEPGQFNPSCRETGKGHGLPSRTTKILRCQT